MSEPGRHAALGALLAAVAAAGFASLAVFGRWALEDGMRANTLLQWRFGLAALALALVGAFGASIPTRTRLVLLGSGFVYTAQTSFYFAALDRISAGTTALLLYLSPAFVVLYSLVLGRRPGRAQVVAVGLALAGSAVILGGPSPADGSAAGLIYATAAGATFAVYLLLGELAFANVPPLTTAAHSMAGAVIGFVAVDLVAVGRLDLPSGGRQWLLVLAVVVVPTILAIPMLFAAIARIGAGPTAIIATAEPAFTLVFAAMFLAEPVRGIQAVGGALILAAAVLAQRAASPVRPVLRIPVDPAALPRR